MEDPMKCSVCKKELNREDMIKIFRGSYICHGCAAAGRDENWMMDAEPPRPSKT